MIFERNSRILLCVGHCAPYNIVDNSKFLLETIQRSKICVLWERRRILDKSILCAFLCEFSIRLFVTFYLHSYRSSFLHSNNTVLWNTLVNKFEYK